MPNVHWMYDPAWVASEGYHHVEANYKLLNDNLLDLSHETYVHGKTIGHDSVAETPIAIRNEGNAVYVDKEMKAAIRRRSTSTSRAFPQPIAWTGGSTPYTSRPATS